LEQFPGTGEYCIVHEEGLELVPFDLARVKPDYIEPYNEPVC